jgi:glutathione synthase
MRIGVVMDAIENINTKKDSTFALLLEAMARHYEIYYFEQQDLLLRNAEAYGHARKLTVQDNTHDWYQWHGAQTIALATLNIIFMRKDPPFNAEYIYSTYILEQAERQGVRIVNKPQGLRDANEKLFTAWFPSCTPAFVVTRDRAILREFCLQYQEIILKPLDAMGGSSIFRVKFDDVNANVIYEMMTQGGMRTVMAQQFIPAIKQGDKRIILIDGKAFPHALVRIPAAGDWRGNLAVGAQGKVMPLTTRDLAICEQVGPVLRQHGLSLVGIDVIGDYLTEINVTSPTGIRELDHATNANISGLLFDTIC